MIDRAAIFAEHYRLYREKQKRNFETLHAIVQLAAEVLSGEEYLLFEKKTEDIELEIKHGYGSNGHSL